MTLEHKVVTSLDEDQIEELERRRRNRLLVELLDQLDAEHGPVDESLIERYVALLQDHDSRTVLDKPRLPGDNES